jgi:2-haloacid dehalogenase
MFTTMTISSQPQTLAFDVYGTLINTHGLISMLEAFAGERAEALSILWRQKQLEYSFRRALMRRYCPFPECTAQALEFACASFQIVISATQHRELLDGYRRLPAFPDVANGLERAREAGFRLFAFSNGLASDVESLLDHAGIREFFLDIVSVDEVRSFKPDPEVYRHFMHRAESPPEQTWLISSNPFDVTGARAVGMEALWVRRSGDAVFDPWEFRPTATISDLAQVTDAVRTARQGE